MYVDAVLFAVLILKNQSVMQEISYLSIVPLPLARASYLLRSSAVTVFVAADNIDVYGWSAGCLFAC